MAVKIIDLDEVLGDDKQVRLAGKTYRLPPDIPVEAYLRINQGASEGLSDPEMIRRLHDELLALFQYGDPSIKTLPLSAAQTVAAIGLIYGAAEEDEEVVPPTRKTPTRGGSSRKAPSRKTKSPSSTS